MQTTTSNIFIISPSAPIKLEKEKINSALYKLQSVGLNVTFSPNCFKDNGNTAGTIKQRVDDIHEGFSNSKYNIIMCSQGGFNSNEILPFLDYEMIKKNPKIFCGMSDITTLCVNLFQKANIQTFYGLQLRHFVNPENTNFDQFLEVIKNPSSIEDTLKQELKPENFFKKGELKGRLIGGNLAILCWLLGTKYSLELFEDSILFIEDVSTPFFKTNFRPF